MDSARLLERYESLLRRAFPHRSFLAEEELLTPLATDTPELVWQSRWFAGDFGRDFVTTEGKSVRIVQFGHWNHGPGPDFQECAVEIDGTLHRGSLELDPVDKDWERHGHHANPAYEDVVVHVYLQRGTEHMFTRTASHRNIPQVHLAWQEVTQHTTTPQPAAKPGRCQKLVLHAWPEDRVHALLQCAARYRLERKSRRWQKLVGLHGPEEAHFQCLAECLGYRNNKLPMTVLSQQFPLKMLRKQPTKAEAWLFGAAGFLDDVKFEESDPPTRAYLRTLWETWWKHRAAWRDSPHAQAMPWVKSSVRPANHPQRRVAALAKIAEAWPQLWPLLQPAHFSEKALANTLEGLQHAYWSHHFTLTADPVAQPLAILGKTRVVEMLANAIYPALIAQQESLWAGYGKLKAPLANEKTKLAALRLFGTAVGPGAFQKLVVHQQGLIQILEDFCLEDASDCAECPFPEQLLREF